METRKITVISTRTQNDEPQVIETNASTLEELKAVFDEKGIDYSGMSIFEGLTKVELVDDSSVLPHDINRRGIVTNDLVIMLTDTNKRIKSGMTPRNELYSKIKRYGLEEKCREYGKNYTVLSNEVLEKVIYDYEYSKTCGCKETIDAESLLVELLKSVLNKTIEDLQDIVKEMSEEEAPTCAASKVKQIYSKEELDERTNWVNNL